MKTNRLFALIILSLAVVSPWVVAMKEDAPGIQKKGPLVILSVSVVPTSSSLIVSWTTNGESDSTLVVAAAQTKSVGDPTIVYDPALMTEHQMTMPYLAAGLKYQYEVISTDQDGNTARHAGRFWTPR